jgi:hypothetical protein
LRQEQVPGESQHKGKQNADAKLSCRRAREELPSYIENILGIFAMSWLSPGASGIASN